MDIAEIKDKIVPILQTFWVSRAALFGSAARGEMRDDSDVDILVEVEQDVSLLGFVEIKQTLEEKLGRRVDLVEYKMIKPSLKDSILSHQIALI